MKPQFIKFTLISLVFVCTSCGFLSRLGGINLAKRYRNTDNVKLFKVATDPQSFVQVDMNSYILQNNTPAPELKYNILSLTREGQAQLIKTLGEKFTVKEEFVKQLNSNFTFAKKADPTVKIIPKTIKKSIILTVERLQYQKKPNGPAIFDLPGDRVSYLEIFLNISDDKNAKFDSWDKYVTDHLTLNLGKVSSAQQWTASVNLAAQTNTQTTLSGSNTKVGLDTSSQSVIVIPGDLTGSSTTNTNTAGNSNTGVTGTGLANGFQIGGNAGASISDTYNSSQDLTTRILKLSGSLGPKKMVLRQEGGQGIDLSGNVVVSLTYELTDDWAKPLMFTKFKDFYNNAGAITEFAALKSSVLTVIYPDVKQDITGSLDYSFLYRQVNHGNRHIPEARQKVTFWYGNVKNDSNLVITKPLVLIKKEDIRPKSYTLVNGANPLLITGKQPLFETVTEAAEFLHYLGDLIKQHNGVPGITVNGNAINSAYYDNLTIQTNNL